MRLSKFLHSRQPGATHLCWGPTLHGGASLGAALFWGEKSWAQRDPWGKPWDSQFPANGAGNWCQSRVCGTHASRGITPPCRHLLDSGFRQMAAIPESAKLFMTGLIERARKLKKTIVFPEGTDARVLEAAARLAREGVVKPVLIGARPANAPQGVEFVDPATSPVVKKYAALYYERRRAKGTTQVEVAAVAKKTLYFASLMVGAGDADGSVGGAVNSTAETVRAALHAVGVHPRARLVQFDALHLPFRPDSDWFYERIAVRNMPRGRNGDWTRYPDILLKWRLYGQPESRCNSGSVEGGRH